MKSRPVASILVVEDEPGIALGLEDTLRLDGYHVEVVDNGTRAIRRTLERPYDLILLDVMLPGTNGFDVCRTLRRAGVQVPIIFLSARTLERDRICGLDVGANDYVTKPFSSGELLARVRGLLRSAEDTRQVRQRFEHDLDAAAQVQERLFPSERPAVHGVDYAGACRPARGVSGDYYDFFLLPSGRLALLLADVCGKGMAAALIAASLRATVRAYAPAADGDCASLLGELNRVLFETTHPNRFATIFYAVYDVAERTLTWVNAGHPPPFLMRGGVVHARLDALTVPAGIGPRVPALQRTVRLEQGDLLLAYSDGIPESQSSGGEELGDSGLAELAANHRELPAGQFCEAILAATQHFAVADQMDDWTVLAAKFGLDTPP